MDLPDNINKIKESNEQNKDPKILNNSNGIEIDIVGPLSFWLAFLIMGVIIQLVLVPFMNSATSQNTITPVLLEISSWILYLPGSIILPLIVALWLGEKIGATKNKIKSAITIATINAIYTALVYIIAIFIIYLLIDYITPTFFNKIGIVAIAEYVVILPIIIIVILIPLIASLSAARHKNIE
ncbi:MAG: hypothetical protein ACP5UN_02205 [Candidatus Micrarchaeia archaeon]